jgi:hypothetical protein
MFNDALWALKMHETGVQNVARNLLQCFRIASGTKAELSLYSTPWRRTGGGGIDPWLLVWTAGKCQPVFFCLWIKSKSKLLYDWRSVNQSVSQYVFGSSQLWDLWPDITSCRSVGVWKLRSCFCGAPSLTRRRVPHLWICGQGLWPLDHSFYYYYYYYYYPYYRLVGQ